MRKLTIKLSKADILTMLTERFSFSIDARDDRTNIHRCHDDAGDLEVEAHWEGSDDQRKM